jgi:hypothetical protein
MMRCPARVVGGRRAAVTMALGSASIGLLAVVRNIGQVRPGLVIRAR